MHTLTDFQVYVQNIGRSVTFLGTPGEERNKVFILRPSCPGVNVSKYFYVSSIYTNNVS